MIISQNWAYDYFKEKVEDERFVIGYWFKLINNKLNDELITVSPQCYLFHMYVGVRAGGGIGDEIEDPAGDPYELYRILFDITFFFFVIVILLAIIQGMYKWLAMTRKQSWLRNHNIQVACMLLYNFYTSENIGESRRLG